MMIKKGDVVKIKPEFQDPGDSAFVWVAVDDEEKNRVLITPSDIGLRFPPVQTVTIDMLEPQVQGKVSVEEKPTKKKPASSGMGM